MSYVTGFKEHGLHTQSYIFRTIDFYYLKYCNLGRETDACMKFATVL